MKHYKKYDFPVDQVRRFIEPGPIVLVSSAWRSERNVMTLGWHMIMEFQPSLIGCYIWDENFSAQLIRKSKQCVINLPTVELAKTAVLIGNTTGSDIDKFATFNLTAERATRVCAPLIKECYANFECQLVDASLIKKYSLFVFEVVKAHVAIRPVNPTTIHYRGNGQFMVSGKSLNLRRYFRADMLE